MGRKSILIILAILVLGFVLRIYRINETSMYGDELTLVYDAYAILKTGHDQTGTFLPITFPMRGRSPGGYVYGSLPFIALFGPTAVGIRLLSVFSGLGIIVLMYFLGRRLVNEKIGLVVAFFLAISPWDIYLSRAGFETHFALFFALLGTVLFLYKKYVAMAVAYGLATLTYPTFKLTVPLMFAITTCIHGGVKSLIRSKTFIVSIIVLSLFGAVVVNEAVRSGGEERFATINVFSNPDLREKIIQRVSEERNFSTLRTILKPIFYNKPLEYSRILLDNYMDNISPNFLYLRGDGNPRHNPGEWGMFYLADFALLVIGSAYLLRENKKTLFFLGAWTLMVPLATMLIGDPHALRNDLMIPPLILLSAYAFTKLKKWMMVLVLLGILVQFIFILQRVYFLAPNKFSNFWSYSAKVASERAIADKSKYDYVFISTNLDNAEFAYPVYAKVYPTAVSEQHLTFTNIKGYSFKKFDNVYVGNVPNDQVQSFVKNVEGKVLFINDYTKWGLVTVSK